MPMVAPKILVVDDEEIDRQQIAQLLKAKGHHVLQAATYNAAVEAFARHRSTVQMLVADISLPEGNGCDLAVAIRKQRPDIRVLFVSGHVGAEVCKYYGLNVSDLHFLRKPFTAAELWRRVGEVLKSDPAFPSLFQTRTFTAK